MTRGTPPANSREMLKRSLQYTSSAIAIVGFSATLLSKIFSDSVIYQWMLIAVLIILLTIATIVFLISVVSEKYIPDSLNAFMGDLKDQYNSLLKKFGSSWAFVWLVAETMKSLPYIIRVLMRTKQR
jgi:hypothetical protein